MLTLEVYCGSEITDSIGMAIAKSIEHGEQCQFDFNGTKVIVAGDSNPSLIYRDWERASNGYIGNDATIGPYPKPLTEAEIASDAAIKAANDKRASERRAEMEREYAAKASALQAALKDAGPIELIDAELWQKCVDANVSDYGKRCVRFAEEWARLMQVRIGRCQPILECGGETSRIADDDGITGFMYGAAVSMLSDCWKHGAELKRWHDKA